MSSLLPINGSFSVNEGIAEYLTTTMGLEDNDAKQEFKRFLQTLDHETGAQHSLFRGPFVRTAMPFKKVDEEDAHVLQWLPSGFVPYVHQDEAFRRLRTADRRGRTQQPSPTAIVTGTGSGKTEAYLYPILDHCVRERAKNKLGPKAIILYPMNALANDQTKRLESLIRDNEELKDLRVGLYIGDNPFNIEDEDSEDLGSIPGPVVIRKREDIRKYKPDIILTNYKMLDIMLHRHADAVTANGELSLWESIAKNLAYLVLDEAHTYDGAQGTDVTMLLRRLGMRIRHIREQQGWNLERRNDALCGVVPVATSATMGEDNSEELVKYLSTLFGVKFSESDIVGETRENLRDWNRVLGMQNFATQEVLGSWKTNGKSFVEVVSSVVQDLADEDMNGVDFDERLHEVMSEHCGFARVDDEHIAQSVRENPWLCRLYALADKFVDFAELTTTYVGQGLESSVATKFMEYLLAWASSLRARIANNDKKKKQNLRAGEEFHPTTRIPDVNIHLWVRELNRVDRKLSHSAKFRWNLGTDTAFAESTSWLPAIYCRHCGRSGWYIGKGDSDERTYIADPQILRRASVREEAVAVLPVISAYPGEESQYETNTARDRSGEATQFYWLDPSQQKIYSAGEYKRVLEEDPATAGSWIGVKAVNLIDRTATSDWEKKRAWNNYCPSCGSEDTIRAMGSAVTTLLSVAVTTLFGMGNVGGNEKKTLIFADSIQDAAHRAGYVEDRSYNFGFRTAITNALHNGKTTCKDIADDIIKAANTKQERFALLPPDLMMDTELEPLYQDCPSPGADGIIPYIFNAEQKSHVEKLLRDRLEFDVMLEFSRRSGIGRTLMLTGVADLRLKYETDLLIQTAKEAVDTADGIIPLKEIKNLTDRDYLLWARGLLERVRIRGGISHPWLNQYRQESCSDWRLNRTAYRNDIKMRMFGRGRAPSYPVSGPAKPNSARTRYYLDSLTAKEGWYAHWTNRAIGIARENAGDVILSFFKALESRGLVDSVPIIRDLTKKDKDKNGKKKPKEEPNENALRTFSIPLDRLGVYPAAELDNCGILSCGLCKQTLPITGRAAREMEGAPCFNRTCEGHLEVHPVENNFYSNFYETSRRTRIIAREHSSVVDTTTRHQMENSFRGATHSAKDKYPCAPNVLVATPTLEMGIDIGDLSMVMLSSLPRTTASYIQRAGRAGRITGNSLVVAVLRGSAQNLQALENPLDTIAGAIQPPTIYLNAPNLIRRQAFAAVLDHVMPLMDERPLGVSANDFFAGHRGLHDCLRAYELQNPGVMKRIFTEFIDSLGLEVKQNVAEKVLSWDYMSVLRAATLAWKNKQIDLKNMEHEASDAARTVKLQQNHEEQQVWAEEAYIEAVSLVKAAQIARSSGQKYWAIVFSDLGLLPNYSLHDHSVTVESSGFRRTEDNSGFMPVKLEPVKVNNDRVLSELAPGSHYYARSLRLNIDAVDLRDKNNPIQTLLLCSNCSYSEIRTENSPEQCPSCGAIAFNARERELDFIDLRTVSSVVRYERDLIDSSEDARRESYYTIHTSCALPPVNEMQAPLETATGFEVQFVPKLTVRHLNLGHPNSGAKEVSYNGQLRQPSLFTLCSYCGKEDVAAGANMPSDHRAYCKHRYSHDQKHNVRLALSRDYDTQGILFYLPPRVRRISSKYAIPSLIAALRLGFSKVIGGALEHTDIMEIPIRSRAKIKFSAEEELSQDNKTEKALLLYDTVRGGTGFLESLVDANSLKNILISARDILSTCECGTTPQTADQSCCVNCLQPFTTSRDLRYTRRAVALKIIEELLYTPEQIARLNARQATYQDLVEAQADIANTYAELDAEDIADYRPDFSRDHAISKLEERFAEQFFKAMANQGARVDEYENARTSKWAIRLKGRKRTWTLEREVRVGDFTQPDFVLRSETDANGKSVAFYIYCDSKVWHALRGTKDNPMDSWRINDDVSRRRNLRAHIDNQPDEYGMIWAITSDMLADYERHGDRSTWFRNDPHRTMNVKDVMDVRNYARDTHTTEPHIERLLSNPMSLLIKIMTSLGSEDLYEKSLRPWTTAAKFLPLGYRRRLVQNPPALTRTLTTPFATLRMLLDQQHQDPLIAPIEIELREVQNGNARKNTAQSE
ncbi:MAG: DEAD/DEAH box helicase, partial [Corynebacterium sp.]|nr:DEAD/DEAH box helicase [Corynebacterium sp.]